MLCEVKSCEIRGLISNIEVRAKDNVRPSKQDAVGMPMAAITYVIYTTRRIT